MFFLGLTKQKFKTSDRENFNFNFSKSFNYFAPNNFYGLKEKYKTIDLRSNPLSLKCIVVGLPMRFRYCKQFLKSQGLCLEHHLGLAQRFTAGTQ